MISVDVEYGDILSFECTLGSVLWLTFYSLSFKIVLSLHLMAAFSLASPSCEQGSSCHKRFFYLLLAFYLGIPGGVLQNVHVPFTVFICITVTETLLVCISLPLDWVLSVA